MSENLRVGVEVLFNLAYLIVIWLLVVQMWRHQDRVAPTDRAVAGRFRWMFLLLALGDSGHVGFRVLAYARGGLQANPVLVGVGALSTAVTVTIFYMLLVDAWRLRYERPLGMAGWFLLGTGVLRLVIMLLPGNDWGQVVPPQPMSLIRNIPLAILGIGVMLLILRDAYRAGDRPFQGIGWCILISYLFYAPVILFVQQVPMVGMLMIPKTLAYVAMALIAYRTFYRVDNQPAVLAT
jgi:hypothetical protein